MRALRCTFRSAILLLLTLPAAFSAPTPSSIPPAAVASAHFDARAATDAWLATVPAANRVKSNAYFEGGYWLTLWDFVYLSAVLILLLETGISSRMRTLAERVFKNGWLQRFLYWIQFSFATAALLFPLTVYEGFFREHQYGLSNQSFGGWLRDTAVGFAVNIVLGGLAVATILILVKRLPRTWHIWAAIAGIGFVVISVMIAPVFIMPLFNKYTSLQDNAIKQQILSLAHANGIPVKDVYQVDASRQSKRVSANVSGLFGTDRITLNDNLLARCSSEGIMAVMGHEMGHYVMHHIVNGVMFMAILLLAMFSILRWSTERALAIYGTRWQIRNISDPAALPLAVLLLLAITFVITPLTNTFTRVEEYEADIFGLDAARQPDGEAEVDLLLGEYRKLDPTPLEEFVFFDHPSGRTRIYAAMRWKAENLCLFDKHLPCGQSAGSTSKSAPIASSRPTVKPLR
ncbi:MAG: M48 family metallopeptidase [Acidobacteriota bacterium]|nr:M48 family metallopeptidase [Acidobacteriota bacterium]